MATFTTEILRWYPQRNRFMAEASELGIHAEAAMPRVFTLVSHVTGALRDFRLVHHATLDEETQAWVFKSDDDEFEATIFND